MLKVKTWDNECAEMNSMVGLSRSKEVWQTINNIRNNTNEKRE